MKLGMLICDHVQQVLQPEFGDYKRMFGQLLEHSSVPIEVEYFYAIDGELPENIDVCDAYMTSGSKWSVNDDFQWIRDLERFIKQLYDAKKGFVGICFGHQLLAKTLGGKVEQSDKGWGIGVSKSKVVSNQDWMNPSQSNLNIVVSHQDQVTQLPVDSQILLSNSFCPYGMIQIGEHFVGLQGHPEFTHEYSRALMHTRKDSIPPQRLKDGEASLQLKTDEIIAVEWLVNFLVKNADKNRTT